MTPGSVCGWTEVVPGQTMSLISDEIFDSKQKPKSHENSDAYSAVAASLPYFSVLLKAFPVLHFSLGLFLWHGPFPAACCIWRMLSGLFWPCCSSSSLPAAPFFLQKLRQMPAKEPRHISANSCSLKICKIHKWWKDCSSRGYSFREHSGPSPFLSDGFLNSSGAVEQSFTTFFSMPDTSSQMQITYAPMHCFTFRNATALIYCRLLVHSLYSCCKVI